MVLDAAGVLAGEVGSEPADGLLDDLDAAGDGALAEAGDAGVGLDFEEEVIAPIDRVFAGAERADGQARDGGEERQRGEEGAPGESHGVQDINRCGCRRPLRVGAGRRHRRRAR